MPKEQHRYKPNTTFNQVMMLYRFDKKLRLLIFNEIEKIEVAVRSAIANIGSNMKTKIDVLLSAYPSIDINAMGFPKGWEDEPLWQ